MSTPTTANKDVIVIVDDNERNLYSIKLVLEQTDREILTFTSGYDLLETLEKQPVHLIILDIQMPEPDGFETARMVKARKKFRDVPIIFLSAVYTTENYIRKGFEIGASDYVSKPVEAELIKNKVNTFLQLFRQKHQLEETNRITTQYMVEIAAITQANPDGYIYIDTDSGIKYINPAALRFLGADEASLIGETEQAIDQIIQGLCRDKAAFQPISATSDNEPYHFTVDNGPTRYYNRLVINIETDSSKNPAKVIYINDESDLKRVEQMKSDFLSTAAHELRTPLASIYGFSELLLHREYDKDQSRDMLTSIHKQAKAITNILNELLDLSRIEAQQGEDFDIQMHPVNTLIRTSIADIGLETLTDKPITLTIGDIDPTLSFPCDIGKLRQVINNIVSNSVKYSKDDIHIQIHLIENALHRKDMIGITFSDNGIGMSEEEVKHVHDRFFRADTTGKIPGTGLGMALVNDIVKYHNGDVDVVSQPDEGTTVTVWLPLRNINHNFDFITDIGISTPATDLVLTEKEQMIVIENWKKIVLNQVNVGKIFYEELFAIDHRTRQLFPENMDDQEMSFQSVLEVLLEAIDSSKPLDDRLYKLGKKHAAYRVEIGDYNTVGCAFIATIRAVNESLSISFSEDIRSVWTKVYQQVATGMIRGQTTISKQASGN